MDAVNTLRNVLLHEMEVGIRSTSNLLQKVKEADWDYSPSDNVRTLRELVHHLAAIPEVDLAIMKENEQDMIQNLEAKYKKRQSPVEIAEAMNTGYDEFKSYMTSLSDQAFLEKTTKPFYLEQGSTQAAWLTETVTHIFHHRAQFFNYLKQLGYDVNMFDLYV